LDQHQLSESDLVDLDLENVIKVGLSIIVIVLLLQANLSIVVELTSKQQVIGWLNLQVIALAEGVDHSVESILILNYSTWLFSDSKQVDSIL